MHSLLSCLRHPAFLVGLSVASAFATEALQAKVCRVEAGTIRTVGGQDWDHAMSLQSALAVNTSGCTEIWLKQGVYVPSATASRWATFHVTGGLTLYGGFVGTETAVVQRDGNPETNFTILSGDSSLDGIDSNNSHHVVVVSASAQRAVLDGLTIRDGRADESVNATPEGGGLYCTQCNMTLNNMRFTANFAVRGGAIAMTPAGSPLITNADLDANEASLHGGAMHVATYGSSGVVALRGVTARGNHAHRGGAIHNLALHDETLDLQIRDSTFHGNSASDIGGAMSSYAVDISGNAKVHPVLENVTISSNTAAHGGGAIANKTMYAASNSADPLIRNSILWGNSGGSGTPGTPGWVIQNTGSGAVAVIQHGIVEYGCDGNVCASVSGADPLLGPLGRHGGLARTRVPAVGSPAIDSGDDATCTSADQRGIVRPQDGNLDGISHCDLGSVEVNFGNGVCRVTPFGVPSGSGDWATPMDLQTALNDSSCTEVWVRGGSYLPTSGSDRSISFRIRAGVKLLGGFAGNENDPGQRDLGNSANQTVLSGAIGSAADTDNSYHVVRFDGTSTPVTPATVLADVMVTAGYASTGLSDFPNNAGAGIYCDGSGAGGRCDPTLSHVELHHNTAVNGGGMYNNASSDGQSRPQLWDVRFLYNEADKGGAMYNAALSRGHADPTLVNGYFNSNDAVYGGAVYNEADEGTASPVFIAGTFYGNTASQLGGAVFNKAGNLASVNPNFSNIRFHSNTAGVGGGAVYSWGQVDSTSQPEFHNVDFHLNIAGKGGALFNADQGGHGTAHVERATFRNNQADYGGAVYNFGEGSGYSTHPVLSNVTFYQNSAMQDGGAIYNNADNGGAASPSFTNATFSANSAQLGGAIYSSGHNGSSTTTLNNVILWQNTAASDPGAGEIHHSESDAIINDSIVDGGCPHSGYGNNTCSNVIDTDPQLGPLADNGGSTKTMLPGVAGSAIDAGNDSTCAAVDQRGTARPQGTHCDIGAVESTGQVSSDIIFQDGFE